MDMRGMFAATISVIIVASSCDDTRTAMDCGRLQVFESEGELPIPPPDAGEEARMAFALTDTRGALNHVAIAVERFCATHGMYPRSVSELLAADSVMPMGVPCRLDLVSLPLDAWNRQSRYDGIDGVPRIASDGPDGLPNTADDVVVPRASDSLPGAEPIDVSQLCRG